MVTLKISGAWKIVVYADDHAPPHFHVHTADGESLVEIATLRERRRGANKRALKDALDWALENHASLISTWNEQNDRK